MKSFKKQMLLSSGLLIMISLSMISCARLNRDSKVKEGFPFADSLLYSIEKYSPDSSFRVVYDSLVHVFNVKSGKKTAEFDLNRSAGTFFGRVTDLAIDAAGKKLVILSDENTLSSWDIPKGKCLLYNPEYTPSTCDWLEFTVDGKFLFLVSFREAFVDILRWPGLEYITTGNLGRYRNSFSWENQDGKLLFIYEEGEALVKITFPDETNADPLVFSLPQLVSNPADD